MKYLLLTAVLLLCGCSATQDVSDVMKVIALSEENAPEGVKGTFQLPIKATAIKGRNIFLNTQMDYRDRRNITVAIPANLDWGFTNQYGAPAEEYLIDKTIVVTGEARRVKIYFYSNAKQTDKYYFQTHVKITSLSQIQVLN